jgi:demethylmenaquinone methyltransferase/2-methoxy-6-polyprenyl-1,4-benzoquinol methylase
VAGAIRELAPQIVVADESMGMLAQARNKNGLLLACSASEQLPFKEGEFERVIMVDAFHHVQDQARTAGELYRVLRPGGILVIIEPDIRKWAVKLIAFMEKILLMRSHFLPAEQIADLFSAPGAVSHIDNEGYEFRITVEKSL